MCVWVCILVVFLPVFDWPDVGEDEESTGNDGVDGGAHYRGYQCLEEDYRTVWETGLSRNCGFNDVDKPTSPFAFKITVCVTSFSMQIQHKNKQWAQFRYSTDTALASSQTNS